MSNLPLAFLMGLLGSLHCAVMCGPLMLSLPLQKTSFIKSAFQVLSYQFGRVLTYTILGMLVGFIGNSFSVFANQKVLSLTIGIVLVVFVLIQLSGKYSKTLSELQFKLVTPISKLMGKMFGLPLWGFFAGFLNGLIPCGMVYLALATALNTATIEGGGTFMFLFGLGTTPLMLMISLGGVYLKKYIRFNTQKLVPWFMLFIGTLFILRSADLGIAFLSPDTKSHNHQHNVVAECK
ncbi:MAG: sulfite exporter TauE/SafE family protein [Pedobacter sp.]|nr:MAG: sulfite exporter TauE/SafE family protein [Pedobacter sp.]